MSHQPTSPKFIQSSLLTKWIAERRHIWQMDFLDERKLASFAKERSVNFGNEHISQLWQLGLLKADLVISDEKLQVAELNHVGQDELGRNLYADERQPYQHVNDWGNAVEELDLLSKNINLRFHPFRYYVLYHLERVLKLHIHPMYMLSQKYYPEVLESEMAVFRQWTAKPEFLENVQYWNSIAALAIATEPYTYGYIFGNLRHSSSVDLETQRKRIADHWTEVSKCYQEVGVDDIEKARQDLCIAAEFLDSNRNVHTILRLTQHKLLPKIKDRLGGAMHLLIMAETLRRATEEAFDIDLPEEEEKGFATYRGHKEKLYGSNRVLDYNRKATHQFLRHFGLDFGVHIRWYVEGTTEYSALNSFLEKFGSIIELINLGGNVAHYTELPQVR